MGTVVEQLTKDGKLIFDVSQSSQFIRDIYAYVSTAINPDYLKIESVMGHKCIVFTYEGKRIILLCAFVTYLGNPHPIFKKRIQLKDWWQDLCKLYPDEDIRFFGIYKHDDLILFVDFIKDSYLEHGLHNSSAHVYTNDLYQGLINGIYSKLDANNNTLVVIRPDRLLEYLLGKIVSKPANFNVIDFINGKIPFDKWIKADDAIQEMLEAKDNNAQQTEWPAFYIEFLFKKIIDKYGLEGQVKYTGSSNKGEGEIDLDLFFSPNEPSAFYGELKSTDITSREIPGNDTETVHEAIDKYGKIWLLVYSLDVKKDKNYGNEMALKRMQLLGKPMSGKISYADKMKHSVSISKMELIEVNEINLEHMVIDFKQGHEPDGKPRKVKHMFIKSEMDNFVIYRYVPS